MFCLCWFYRFFCRGILTVIYFLIRCLCFCLVNWVVRESKLFWVIVCQLCQELIYSGCAGWTTFRLEYWVIMSMDCWLGGRAADLTVVGCVANVRVLQLFLREVGCFLFVKRESVRVVVERFLYPFRFVVLGELSLRVWLVCTCVFVY